jgi:hypothetical protein
VQTYALFTHHGNLPWTVPLFRGDETSSKGGPGIEVQALLEQAKDLIISKLRQNKKYKNEKSHIISSLTNLKQTL